MLYQNDISRLDEAIKSNLKKVSVIVIASFIWSFFTVIIAIKNFDHYLLILSITFVCGLISILFGLYFGNKRFIKEFKSYQINIGEQNISIISDIYHQIINIKDIKEIRNTKNGRVYIKYNNKTIFISQFINNFTNMKNELNNIIEIKEGGVQIDYIGYISLFFFCCLFFIRFIPDYRIYIVIGSGFVITSIISIGKLILTPIKKRNVIFTVIINLVLIAIVLINIIRLIAQML